MSVSKNDEILTLIWKQDTANLTNDKFKNEALKFINIVKEQNSKKILVDMRKFFFNLSDDLIAWQNENLISVYNTIKVEKFAFVNKKETINQDNSANTFVTRYFLTEEDACIWLSK